MILLIQFRTDQSGWHELKCFYENSGKSYHDFVLINAYTPELDWTAVHALGLQAEKIIIGGSGESGYEYPDDERFFAMIKQLRPVLAEWLEADKSILGICLGHQIIADTIGGTVIPDPRYAEAGTIEINLNKAGRQDPLFKNIPLHFHASTAHKTSVLALPASAQIFAKTKHDAIQIFRYRSAYGVQFHPELDEITLEYRLSLYPEYKQYESNITREHDFNHSHAILQAFVK